MLENKYSKMSISKRRLYISANIVKILLTLVLVTFSDMLVISGMRTMYKGNTMISILMISIRTIIVIIAIVGIGIYIYRIVGLVKNRYIIKKVHIKGTHKYRDVIAHIKNIPKEIVDELFK